MRSASVSCSARVGQVERHVGHHVGEVWPQLADAEERAERCRQRAICVPICARDALARVLAQRVRDLVAHHRGELVVGELSFWIRPV